MTNDNGLGSENDVRWLDEQALVKAILEGDREAFAELIERFDPVVRAQLSRASAPEAIEPAAIELELAAFWCGLLGGARPLAGWQPGRGGLLAGWLAALAAQAVGVRVTVRRAA